MRQAVRRRARQVPGLARRPKAPPLATIVDLDETDPREIVGTSAEQRPLTIGISRRSRGNPQRAPVKWRHHWPDIALDRTSNLPRAIDSPTRLAPVAEAMAAGEDPTHHWGSVIRLAPDTFALGRYFAMADARYPGHALSHLLLDSKSDPTARTTLAGIFAAIATLPLKNRSDIIATVPPAPAKSDRFAVARAALARALSAQDGALLAQRYAVTDYWHLPRSRREPTIADRFEVTSRLSGQSVLLIDDILTSGAQATACRKALKQSGAGQITTVVAAITQDVVTQLCPSCGTTEGGKVRTKRRRIDAQEFQGCTRFPICRWSRSL